MINPTLSKKSEKLLTVTDNAKKLFQVIYQEQNKEEKKDDLPKIQVSDLISKMAFYYEKIRNSVDYKEEHLLRKNAIDRILKRQIVIEGVMQIKSLNSQEISRHLLIELIRAGYLVNNKIPEKKINEVRKVIDKYLNLRNYFLQSNSKKTIQEKNELSKFIISMCACDIEEKLGRNKIDMTVVDIMFNVLDKNISIKEEFEFEKDRKIQIYIGIYRNFLKFDNDMLGFILFKYFNENWDKASDDEIKRVAQDLVFIKLAIDKQLNHFFEGQMNRIISRYTVFFNVLIDVVAEDPIGTYSSFKNDPKAFPRQIKKICNIKYNQAGAKKWRAAIRSIIYIFITKSVFVFFLEYPIVMFLDGHVQMTSLAINISFPVVLLFIIVLFAKVPGDNNSEKIIDGINEIVFVENEKKEPFKLKKPIEKKGVLNTIFGIIYFSTFAFSLWAIVLFLEKLDFNWVSMIIFMFFLAFISFFGIRIKKGVSELLVLEPKESILGLLIDFFYVPIIIAGKWLSEKFSRINIFVIILDFIIEAPFKIFIEIAEAWTKYVKERKDEIV